MTLSYSFALASLHWPESGWLSIVLWFVLTLVGVWLLRPVATLFHELGHAIPALILTEEVVEVRIGVSSVEDLRGTVAESQKPEGEPTWRNFGRLRWACNFHASFQGFTGYDREALGRWALLAVIAGGPLFSCLACGLGAWLTLEVFELTWQKLVAATFLCSNLIVFLRSTVPVTLNSGEPSDGLDFWKTWRHPN